MDIKEIREMAASGEHEEQIATIDKSMIMDKEIGGGMASLESLLLDMVTKLENNQRFLADIIDVIIKYLRDKNIDDEFLLTQLFKVRMLDWKFAKHRDLNYIKHKLNILEEKHDGLQGELIYKTTKLQEAIKGKRKGTY